MARSRPNRRNQVRRPASEQGRHSRQTDTDDRQINFDSGSNAERYNALVRVVRIDFEDERNTKNGGHANRGPD